MATSTTDSIVKDKPDDTQDDTKTNSLEELDTVAPLKDFKLNSDVLSTPRRMSVQQALNNITSSLQEEFTSSAMSTHSTVRSSKINRRIEKTYIEEIRRMDDPSKSFSLGDILHNLNSGMQVITDDDFSLCFKRPHSRPWNFNAYLFVFWLLGIIIRYLILFPLRLLVMILSILLTLLQFWLWKKIFKNNEKKLQKWELWSLKICVQCIIASWGGVVEYKGVIATKRENQIYVCNHTTMLDWLLLMQMTPFCVVGQLQSSRPLVKWFQTELLKSLNCIWFNRAEQKDRALAMKRIKEHIADETKPRLLIFPEGTCVNNRYCIQFKKGAFSLGCEICPISIKYNPSFIDAYWISRQRPFGLHLMDIMTSWAMVAEVTYLEPQTMKQNETSIQFASRVKKLIANAAGLKNVQWNGYLKHYKPSQRVIDAQKKVMAEHLDTLYSKLFNYNINQIISQNGIKDGLIKRKNINDK